MCPDQGFAYLKVKSIGNEELMNLKKKKKLKKQTTGCKDLCITQMWQYRLTGT